MQDEQKGHWKELCAQPAVEQDGEKLLALVKQINQIPDAQERLSERPQAKGKSAAKPKPNKVKKAATQIQATALARKGPFRRARTREETSRQNRVARLEPILQVAPLRPAWY